jgi:Fic family protein
MASLKDIIKEIDAKVALLQSLLPLRPQDQQRLEKKLRLEFNYNSNHIEGNTLTYGETELLLFFDETKGGHQFREQEEMKAHDIALKIVQEESADAERPLSEQFIRSLNQCILVRPFWKEAITLEGQATQKQVIPGQYKTSPNSVRLSNGEIFNYASPEETPSKMRELVLWYLENNKKEHPLVVASLLHYQFVSIHPFDDGNGRVARLLMNYVLLKNNLPMVVIKSKDKSNYIQALNYADTGEIDAFVIYIGKQLLWSLDLTIKAANGEEIDEPDDLDKKIAVLSKKINQNEGHKKKSAEVLEALLNDSILPFLDDLITYLKKFETFYDNIQYQFVINNQAQYGDDFKQFKDSSLHTLSPPNKGLDILSVRFFFKGFKPDMASGFTTSGNIDIFFEEYRYGIRNRNAFEEYWSYDNYLSKKDKTIFLKQITDPLYEDIEQKVYQLNKKKI